MPMSWLETIQYIGLDLQVATVVAVGVVDLAIRALRSTWGRGA
jgi:hypothetical protein